MAIRINRRSQPVLVSRRAARVDRVPALDVARVRYMSEARPAEITQILQSLHSDPGGRCTGSDRLFERVYSELRELASGLMRRERKDHTLQSTALVHEAYVRLLEGRELDWQSRAHFFGSAARAMRRILVEHARRRASDKRGGAWRRVTLDENLGLEAVSASELIELDDVLSRLGQLDERMARIVELRVFAGMTGEEIGHVLGLSRQTVQEEWKVAKMWLRHKLAGDSP